MRKTIPLFFFLLLSVSAMAQKHCISGYVMDAASRETLIGATILDRNTGQGCATNNYGYYSLTLPEGAVDLQFSFVGYDAVNQAFTLLADTVITVKMSSNIQLQEVTVEANRATVAANNPQMSVIELPVKQIKAIPTLMGEADVLKAIQLLPGVQNGQEGSAGLYVRGGGPDENLLLMDGVPLYNVCIIGIKVNLGLSKVGYIKREYTLFVIFLWISLWQHKRFREAPLIVHTSQIESAIKSVITSACKHNPM